MHNINLNELKRRLNFKTEEENKMLERAYLLNQNITADSHSKINCNIYCQTAIILREVFGADFNTIISSLIYKYVKRFYMSDYEVLSLFNQEILNKIKLLKQFDDNLLSLGDINKLMTIKSITEDVKVTIIKLVERLSVLQCIDDKSINQYKMFIDETLNFYIPVIKLIGIYSLKNSMEDLCFKYDTNYGAAQKIKDNVGKEYNNVIKAINLKMNDLGFDLSQKMKFELNRRSDYEIYSKANEIEKRVKEIANKSDIKLSGFCSVKCLVDTKEECYKALYLIHQFSYQMGSFNDYLSDTGESEYRAIHTNVFINHYLVDFRICTKEMDRINLYGITSDWKYDPDLQTRLSERYDFYRKLQWLNENVSGTSLIEEFNRQIIDDQFFSMDSIELKRDKGIKLIRKTK